MVQPENMPPHNPCPCHLGIRLANCITILVMKISEVTEKTAFSYIIAMQNMSILVQLSQKQVLHLF